MNADKALELARLTYPNDENLRVAYMLGLNAGAEWQASQMPMLEDTVLFNKGVAEGRKLEREDMLEDAVEGYVTINRDALEEGFPYVTVITDEKPLEYYKSRGFKLGDKVKIVIIPEKED